MKKLSSERYQCVHDKGALYKGARRRDSSEDDRSQPAVSSSQQRKSLVKLHLEYCSHIWAGAAKCHLELLNNIQRRATRLVGDANLISQLAPLDARCRVASLSLFYNYFHDTVLTALLS